jgi:acetylglutamate/LysW-gamma-L-alpha-aminoadipate kinase
MMTYSGSVNQRIVELCQRQGINALGLSGIDGALIRGKRNRGIKIKEGSKIKLVRDFSGKPKQVNENLLRLLLDNGYVPVISIPILDEKGFAINSENDDIVGLLKDSLDADKIVQLIEAPGFLEDKDDDSSVVKEMKSSELLMWEQKVQGRMKRKILALRKLFQESSCTVYISDGRVENPVKDALAGKGSVIR